MQLPARERYFCPTTVFAENIALLLDCQTNMPSNKLIFTENSGWDQCVSRQSFESQMTNKSTDWVSEVEYSPSDFLGD